MPPKGPVAKFTEGERVLCFHGPLLYEAKCVKPEVKDKSIRYFIHYNGWNKNWDEWVPESRVLKYSEAALQKQRELQKAHAKNKAALKGSSKGLSGSGQSSKKSDEKVKDKDRERASTPSSEKIRGAGKAGSTGTSTPDTSVCGTPDQPKKKRARVDPTVESEDSFLTKIEVKIRIPDELKPWLVDDWDLITRQKQLVRLPAKITVDSILDDYVKMKLTKPNNPQKDAILEVTQGIREYFNVMLGTQLLYKFERPQYAELLADHPDASMSSMYGTTHMLRLFVKLGGMLAYTPLDEKSIHLLLTHVHDLLRYMQKNSASYFNVADYSIAPPEYHRKAI